MSNTCNNCSSFNPIGRCEAWLPPSYDLLKTKQVDSTDTCELFSAGEHYSTVEGGDE